MCVCAHIYICVYIYIYIYMCMYIYVYVYVYFFLIIYYLLTSVEYPTTFLCSICCVVLWHSGKNKNYLIYISI